MVEQSLLVLRIAFVVLLYLFVWRVVRMSVRDVRPAQESMILSPGAAAAAGLTPLPRSAPPPAEERTSPRLVVTASTVYPVGTIVLCDDTVVFGRSPGADAVLEGDGYVSGRHAQVFRRGVDVYVEDLGSTNGTLLNGTRLAAPQALSDGDVVAIGATELRFERAST